ncbi:hypothetical protein TNCV_4816011 [Trichonephila clavipes]|nr:hypothetical protein TNCV_4816011 [Trichonephila clavipes]
MRYLKSYQPLRHLSRLRLHTVEPEITVMLGSISLSNTFLASQIARSLSIEHIWDIMGRRLHLPGNVDELAKDWSKFGKKHRRRPSGSFITPMPRCVAACIQTRDDSTPY